MDSVTGKIALVTGAAQGIGYGVAHILLQNGAKVKYTPTVAGIASWEIILDIL